MNTEGCDEQISRVIRERGYLSRDPDWPNTFVISNDDFHDIAFAMPIIIRERRISFKGGYLCMDLDGKHFLRVESPNEYYALLWKEISEKDSAKSTDL